MIVSFVILKFVAWQDAHFVQETAIEDYFKPLDKEAEIIMKMQIQGEERTSEIMMQALEKQATLQQAEAEKNASKHQVNNAETNMNESEMMEEEKTLTEMLKALQQEVLLEKADTESDVNAHQADNSPINLSSASTTTSKWSWDYFETLVIPDFYCLAMNCISACLLKCQSSLANSTNQGRTRAYL